MEKRIFGLDNSKTMTGDEVVISGISGVFPQSDSVLEFSENLFNKVNMVSGEPRWTSVNPEVPKHVGKISNIDKFDAQFFKVGYQQAKVLEPTSMKILEHAYGAVFDSGNTPATLKGVKIGVFVGAAFTDFSACSPFHITSPSDFLIGGTSKSMFANRISYWIDGTGPSYYLDLSCASSAAALEKAYISIRHGDCDAAVVGSGNICLLPSMSLNLRKAGLLCIDGKTKCFDKNADGYVRAEAVSLLFLQKSKDAKRIYAEIYHAKGIYKMSPDAQFLPIRKSHDMQKFLKDFYSETDIEPENVEYVEANGAAIAKADENELDAIGIFFGNNKTVKIGCVKSNMGHSEAASGLTAVTKMCIAYHKGEIPANLHYKTPLEISAVQERKVQILTEHTKFNRDFVALNNFSYTGANYHVVLKGHYKEKNLQKYKCQIPRILLASGREESCINKIFDSLKRKPIDAEEIALLHNIFEKDIMGHTGRGYSILDTTDQGETTSISESIDYYSGVRRPLWFVFSGMGSQWPGMGADLMHIPTFAKAIKRCHKVLEPKGVDIIKIISEPDKTIFDNILNAFVGIGAVQIGLTDILKEMGLEPDYIIGHSLGEMACAYQDNTFTAEELILATYKRGIAVLDSILEKGSMAAVGLGYKTLVHQCPPEIDIGCHNSSESSTISGPIDAMKEFVAELTKRGIFAKEVPSADIAYHSRYVADAGPKLLQSLRDVIKHPKLRSKKWLSTSVPIEHWGDQIAKYSSPEYHANNLLSPVLFEEVISMMPSNAVVVEIAPHGLLQAILKRSHPECTHIPLTRRGCPDAVKFLLDGIGKLYKSGYNPKVDILYPKVEFPVSTETPLLSHLVQWEHSETWPLLNNQSGDRIKSLSRDVIISIHDDDYSYIADRVINGTTTIPEAALLVYVWETLAMYAGCRDITDISVIFSDVKFNCEVVVKPEAVVKLSIMISKGNDSFEISQDDILVVSGTASCVKDIELKQIIDSPGDDFEDVCLNSEDVYKLLRNRGYFYEGALKSICSFNLNRSNAFVTWTKDWVPFLDSLIQLNTLTRNFSGISQPKFIRKLKINVLEQKNTKAFTFYGIDCHTVQLNKTLGVTRCAGVEINNITYIDKLTVNNELDVLIEKSFFPYFAMEEVNMPTAIQVNLQIVAENANSRHINLIKSKESMQTDVFKNVEEITDCLLNVIINVKSVSDKNELQKDLDRNITNVLLLSNLLDDAKKLIMLHNLITNDDFILTLEKQIPKKQNEIKDYFSVLTCMSDGKQTLILLRKLNRRNDSSYIRVSKENEFLWIPRMHDELATTKKVVLVSEKQSNYGLLGLVQKLKRDKYKNIALMANLDFHIQPFNPNDDDYKEQLQKNLCINVLKKGQWGGYYYKSCLKSKNLRTFALKKVVPGDIDELSWIEPSRCSAKNNIVQVCYSGLSLYDYYKADNIFENPNNSFGMDFSGIDKHCDKVMGIIQGGAVSSTVEVDPDLLWPVPDHWSLEDAATVPLPYLQAYYCLVLKVQLKQSQRVLVTGGAGALGQAVISLCLHQNCTIFTTVSEMAKKKMLLSLFPELNENNICFSDCDNLQNMVMTNTQNKGCNLVINWETGALREAAMKCVGFSGFFLDLSKLEMVENNNIGMSYLIKAKSYRAVDISHIFKPEYAASKKFLHRCLSEGIARGVVTPLTRVVYSPPMVSRAFRLLSTRRHRGRVLLRLRDPVIMNQGLNVLPRLGYNFEDVVIIICDEKGLGVELADKIIERGAKKIVLHMKPNYIMTGYLNAKLISWSKHEVSVKLSSENLHIEAGCASLMKNAMKFGKVTEVYIIQDGKRDGNGGKDDYISTYNNKCLAVINLDTASRTCADIRYFTIIASLAQSLCDEYAVSLSERVCELRKEKGLPALVIRYESLAELNEFLFPSNKVEPQSLSTFFNSLETSLKMKYNNVLTFNLKEKHNFYFKKLNTILGVKRFYYMDNEKSLQDFNLNVDTLNELSMALKNFYQIDRTIQDIRRMTIGSLKRITDRKHNIDFESGMAAFYKEVDNEKDYVSQQPLVVMPTLLNNSNENNIDPSSSYLIMIPGFEGRVNVLKSIAERLKIQAVGIQLGPDMEGDSFREIAENFRKLLKIKFQTKSTFYVLGYSLGVNIALELAAIFEREGHVGVVYCIDSSPDALRIHLDAYLGSLSEDELQNTILNHMYCIMAGSKKDITQDLETNYSFADKVDCTLKKLKEVVTYSKQYQKQVLEAAYKRIKLSREYHPDIKLDSELILMKSTPHPNANLTTDYNLSKYTKKPIKVFSLESDHGLAYQDTRVSNIVNKFLAKKILEEFRNVNLCNVYNMTDNML